MNTVLAVVALSLYLALLVIIVAWATDAYWWIDLTERLHGFHKPKDR